MRKRFTARGYEGAIGPVSSRPIISSVILEEGLGHDTIHIWNRGGKAGQITVEKDDGEYLAILLIGPHHTVTEE